MKNENVLPVPDSYIVFDLETTGLSPKYAEIIEIGAIKTENGRVTEKFRTYVKPYGHIPRAITELTGITEEMTADAPHIEDALPKFLSFIGEDILYAHNSAFDCRFIGTACVLLGYDVKNEVRDSLELARKYIKSENYKLETLKKLLGIKRPSHNALDDCFVTHALIEECKSRQRTAPAGV